MSQWAVYPAPKGAGKATRYVVDIQSNHVADLPERYVIPLADTSFPAVKDLNPPVEFDGQQLAAVANQMVRMPRNALGRSVGSIEAYQDEIKRALNLIFTGF